MAALIAASSLRTCLGDGAQTFAGLLTERSGVGSLRHPVPGTINVTAGYHIDAPDPELAFRASSWLGDCVREAVLQAGLDTASQRVVAIVGTGLRELAAVEQAAGQVWGSAAGARITPSSLHFGQAVRAAAPGVAEIITVANACSAGGHALALAQDMVETGVADAVIVGAADAMTTSMLAMIGKVAQRPTDQVRPFDADRQGVLLGEGAGAVVVVAESWSGPVLARLRGTGLSCDAVHETAPDIEGICRAMRDAHTRAGVKPADVDLVVAHGTGTGLNDPTECAALRAVVLDSGGDPLITAVKGAVGHLSGAAALANLDVAIRSLATGQVPPVVGLRKVLPEGAGMRFARTATDVPRLRLAQVNAFGFGGVNAVTIVEAR